MYDDSESFVTSAYLAKMKAQQEEEERERRQDAIEGIVLSFHQVTYCRLVHTGLLLKGMYIYAATELCTSICLKYTYMYTVHEHIFTCMLFKYIYREIGRSQSARYERLLPSSLQTKTWGRHKRWWRTS